MMTMNVKIKKLLGLLLFSVPSYAIELPKFESVKFGSIKNSFQSLFSANNIAYAQQTGNNLYSSMRSSFVPATKAYACAGARALIDSKALASYGPWLGLFLAYEDLQRATVVDMAKAGKIEEDANIFKNRFSYFSSGIVRNPQADPSEMITNKDVAIKNCPILLQCSFALQCSSLLVSIVNNTSIDPKTTMLVRNIANGLSLAGYGLRAIDAYCLKKPDIFYEYSLPRRLHDIYVRTTRSGDKNRDFIAESVRFFAARKGIQEETPGERCLVSDLLGKQSIIDNLPKYEATDALQKDEQILLPEHNAAWKTWIETFLKPEVDKLSAPEEAEAPAAENNSGAQADTGNQTHAPEADQPQRYVVEEVDSDEEQ